MARIDLNNPTFDLGGLIFFQPASCETKKLLDLRGLGFQQSQLLLKSEESDATKIIDFVSNHLFEQARQSKG